MAEKVRKLPVEVEAMQWDGTLTRIMEIDDWAGAPAIKDRMINWRASEQRGVHTVTVTTLHGRADVEVGDWIVRGPAGDVWPVKPDIFEQSYEPVRA